MKYLIIVGDGMADERMPQLGGKSPLEVADIPTINRLARQGVVGHAQNCPPGFSVGSDIAHLSILGCDPSKHFHGRGPMEAAALGFAVEPTDAVFRCNLLTMEDGDGPLDEKGFVSFNVGCIEGEDALEVVRTLKADPDFAAALKKYDMELRETPTFRQILIHHHGDFEGLYFETNWEGVKGPCKQVFPRGNEAKAEPYLTLMRLANKALEHAPINERRRKEGKLPANGIWLWAEGKAAELPSLQERYGKSGAVVAAVPVVKGLGAMCGLDMVDVEGANGEIDTNIEGKVEAAWEMVNSHDFVLVHLEAPDECAHAGDLKNKIQAIEWLDSRLITPLLGKMDEAKMEYRLLIISDHRTFVRTKQHEGSPVPFILYDSRVDTKRGVTYTEENGMNGPDVPHGDKLLDILFENIPLL